MSNDNGNGRGRGRPVTQPCGTVAAYKRHRRNGEPACGPCKAAWADHQRKMRANRKRRKQAG